MIFASDLTVEQLGLAELHSKCFICVMGCGLALCSAECMLEYWRLLGAEPLPTVEQLQPAYDELYGVKGGKK